MKASNAGHRPKIDRKTEPITLAITKPGPAAKYMPF